MARLAAVLYALLLFAGAIATPILPHPEYDIVDDSEGAKFRRHDDDCKHLKPTTIFKTKTKYTTTQITVPTTVFQKTWVKTTITHFHTKTEKVTAKITQTPSTVKVKTKIKTTVTLPTEVPGTVVLTSFATVTPTQTITETITTTTTAEGHKPRGNNGGKCHRITKTSIIWVTSTKSVYSTTTTTQPVTEYITKHKNARTTTTVTDATITVPATTTYTTTILKTHITTVYSTVTKFTTTTTTTTTQAPTTTTTTTTTTTVTVKPPIPTFCDKLHPVEFKDFKIEAKGEGQYEEIPGLADLKECCMKCQSVSNDSCQWFAFQKGEKSGTCKVYYNYEGFPITKTCPKGQVSITYFKPEKDVWVGHGGPCASKVSLGH